MSLLTLSLKHATGPRIDCASLLPERLSALTTAAIASLELPCGNAHRKTEDLFEISGTAGEHLLIRNAHGRLDHIGHGMTCGNIEIEGNVGAYLGYAMRGGTIVLRGHAGVFAACEMAGGLLHIHGNTGDFLAGALPGNRKGMRGGTVIVNGDAGDRVGDQMRRGMILIDGNAGDYLGSRMIAGTIGVLGHVGRYPGLGMRRGTVMLAQQPEFHPSMRDCGMHTLPFLTLFFKAVQTLPSPFKSLDKTRVQRYAGDLACNGRGEFLIFS